MLFSFLIQPICQQLSNNLVKTWVPALQLTELSAHHIKIIRHNFRGVIVMPHHIA